MSLDLPTPEELRRRVLNSVVSSLPELNPSKEHSFTKAFVESMILLTAFYNAGLEKAYKNNFLLTADRQALIKKGVELDYPLPTPQKARGLTLIQANAAGMVLQGGIVFSSGSLEYISKPTVSIKKQNNVATAPFYDNQLDITRVECLGIHNFYQGLKIKINQIDYHVKDIINETTFTLQGNQTEDIIESNVISTFIYEIEIEAKSEGVDYNIIGGSLLSNNANLQDSFVSYAGIYGGTNEITTEEYRVLLLENSSLKGGYLNRHDIGKLLLENNYVHVKFNIPYVQEDTQYEVGNLYIYLLRKEDTPLSTIELNAIKNLILTIYPVNANIDNIHVENASRVKIDFAISKLKMNTPQGVVNASFSIRRAVEHELEQFFKNEVEVGSSVEVSEYRNAISRAVDSFGNTVSSFEVVSPAGIITINPSQKAVLGNVSYV